MSFLPRPLLFRFALVLILLGGAVSAVMGSFFKEERGVPDVVSTVEAGAADFVRVDARIVEIDPLRGRMTLELGFSPHGRFDAGAGLLAVPLEIDFSTLSGEPLEFAAARKMFLREVEVGFTEGARPIIPSTVTACGSNSPYLNTQTSRTGANACRWSSISGIISTAIRSVILI